MSKADRRSAAVSGGRADFGVGSPASIVHAKPWKRTITMRGIVSAWDGELLTLERQFSGGGQYDSLNLPKLAGDWGTIETPIGGRVLRRTYYRRDGTLVGELFNIQTPAQLRNGAVHYIDLEVDVMRLPGGIVRVVDEDDLEAAVRAGGISRAQADEARALAYRLAEILRQNGDWRTADAPAADRPSPDYPSPDRPTPGLPSPSPGPTAPDPLVSRADA
ncbi:MAG: DUF402 domain-containing protein [Chloroflexi bacterium]|nr:DUF402 domain-containing protein [Chloroflexota bacterium]